MATSTEWDELFSHRPKEDQMPVRWDIVRAGPKGLGNLIVLSHDVVGADVHYWNGRTMPCIPASCPACQENQQPRWRGYLAITNRKRTISAIVEVTAAAMPPIKKYFDQRRTLRGANLGLYRKGGATNGRLYAEICESSENKETLPKGPSLKKLLAQIWQLKRVHDKLIVVAPDYQEPPTREADFGDEAVA